MCKLGASPLPLAVIAVGLSVAAANRHDEGGADGRQDDAVAGLESRRASIWSIRITDLT